MMVKRKKRKEENEDDEHVKSSNKSSTPLLLPRLANGRTSLCLLLWCCCFLVSARSSFFFNLTRTRAHVNFSRRTKKGNEDESFQRDVCFSLSLGVPLGVGLSMRKKKKSTHELHLLFRREQRFPRFNNTCKVSVVAVVIARVAVPVTP